MADDIVIPDDLKALAGKYSAGTGTADAGSDIVIPDDIKGMAGKYAKPAQPVEPKKPGLMERAGKFLSEGRSQPDPSLSGITPEQARGMVGEPEAQAPAAQPPPAAAPGLDSAVPRGTSVLDRAGPQAQSLADPMLRPGFVDQFRQQVLSGVRPEDRMDVLRTISQRSTGNNKRAADQLLRQAQAENGRITLEDEGAARRIGPLGPEPEIGGGGKRARVEIPDVTPGIRDTMEGAAAPDIANRRMLAGGLRRAADSPDAISERGERAQSLNPRTAGEFAADEWVALKQGWVTTKQVLANSIDPGSSWAKGLNADMKGLDKEFTPQAQRQAMEVATRLAQAPGEVEKFGVMLAELLTEPTVLMREIARQAPLMAAVIGATVAGGIAGGGVARGAAALAPRSLGVAEAIAPGIVVNAGRAAGATATGAAARAVGAGGDAAGQVFEHLTDKKKVPDELLLGNADVVELLKEGKTLDEAREIVAKSKARIAQGLGSMAGIVFGGMGLDALIAKRLGGDVAKRSAIKAMAKEAGGEVVEESLTQVAANTGIRQVDPTRSLTEGTGEAAALALATSIPMSAGAAAVARPDVLKVLFTPSGADRMAPTELRAKSISRFDELAAAFGLNPAAAAKVKQQAGAMPADDVPGFFERAVGALGKRGLFARSVDPAVVEDLNRRLDGQESGGKPDAAKDEAVSNIEATLKAAGALPDEAINAPGLVDGQNDTGLDETLPRKIAGDPINREWTAFAPTSGTLGIPRAQMPQIAAEHRGALVNFLNARGVAHEMAEVDPAELKPTQAEFQPKKVAGIAESPSTRSLLVSSDGHILDGHHQWMAASEAGRPVRVVRLDAPIQDLLRLAHQFPSSTTAKGPSKTAGATNDIAVVPDPAPSIPRSGPDGPGAAGVSGGTVRPVADDAQRGNAADPAAAAASGRPGDDAGRGRGDDAALKTNESDQDRSNREWRENYEAVVSTDDLGTLPEGRIRQAINYAAKRFVNLQPAAWGGDQAAKDQMTALDRERDLMEFHLKTRKAPNAAAPVPTQPPAQAGATEAAAPAALDSVPRGGVGPPGFRGMTWRQAVDKIVAEHGRAAFISGDAIMFPSGNKGQSNGIGGAPADVLAYAQEALKPKPEAASDWLDEQDADPFESEKLNLTRIKEIAARQKMSLDTDHMRSDGLAATGWSAESVGTSGKAAAPRVIGKYGRTPNGATEIELRPNADGTLTPHTGKYPMVDFESGNPISLPADVTDAQAAKAIRDAGAVTAKDKFYGVKEDAAPAAAPAPAPQATPEELLSAAEKRVDGLKALLACLTS